MSEMWDAPSEPAEEESASNGQRIIAGVVTGLVCLAAILLFAITPSLITNYKAGVAFYESPAFVPRVALAIVAISALVHAFRIARGTSLDAGEEIDDPNANRGVVIAGMALIAAYILAVPYVGYAMGTTAFVGLASILASLGRRKALLLAVGFGSVLFLVFVLGLKVWFPRAALLDLFS